MSTLPYSVDSFYQHKGGMQYVQFGGLHVASAQVAGMMNCCLWTESFSQSGVSYNYDHSQQ
ncbi:hypothetical protein HMPREF1326_00021 [Akkermansia sp. KLE1605]|nr:hypothetical protein HMPREF1326_00021 [Akkermansia sp. KLE1605]